MNIRRIYAAYFSPTGNCRKIALGFAENMAEISGCSFEEYDFTLPSGRERVPEFGEEDYVAVVLPAYAGRIPNKILPWFKECFRGNGARATAIISFGNRNPDSALGELKQELEHNGFKVVSAAAVVSEHAFTDKLAGGRPDEEDMDSIRKFAAESLQAADRNDPVDIGSRGQVNPYYVPLRSDGKPAKFLKAKPVRDDGKCIECEQCAEVCPMGSINAENTGETAGICIKCQACIHKCAQGARYFDDSDFISHRDMLICNFAGRCENELYI